MQIQVVESLSFRLRSSATPPPRSPQHGPPRCTRDASPPFWAERFPMSSAGLVKSCQVELRCRLMPPQLWSYDCSSGTWSHLFVWPGTESIHSQKAAQSSQPFLEQFDKHQSFTPSSKILCRLRSKEHVAKRLCFKPGRNANEGLVISHLPKIEVYGSWRGDSKQSHTDTFQSNLMWCQCKGKRSQIRKILTSTWRCRSQTEAAPVHRFNSVTNLNAMKHHSSQCLHWKGPSRAAAMAAFPERKSRFVAEAK